MTTYRTIEQDRKLKQAVGELWGTVQKQEAARIEEVEFLPISEDASIGTAENKEPKFTLTPYTIDSSDINVGLKLEHRKKGLLWYATYRVNFEAKYSIKNDFDKEKYFRFTYSFPSRDGIYDNFIFSVDGQAIKDIQLTDGVVKHTLRLKPGQAAKLDISYGSQGMDEWWYVFGKNVTQIRNFKLTATTDFDDIDFPENGISPTLKTKTAKGQSLTWQYASLISGIQIGIGMPQKLNPGPFASRVSYFAPVSLFLFLFLIFIISIIRKIDIHPMNYFFVSAAFFSFHLLLTYLADHTDIYLAFTISSIVSILLVTSYMRLVVGLRFALLEIGISQLIYLVFFSYTFFLSGYTGLTVTICCILTLFAVMQFTGKTDWGTIYSQRNIERPKT